MALSVWTVAELGAFYTEHRSELLAHANRVLKDSAKAEEITQDSLIKFMLAAPELESEEHALSYLHRTIENLCIDYFRMEGRRPNLVVIDDSIVRGTTLEVHDWITWVAVPDGTCFRDHNGRQFLTVIYPPSDTPVAGMPAR